MRFGAVADRVVLGIGHVFLGVLDCPVERIGFEFDEVYGGLGQQD